MVFGAINSKNNPGTYRSRPRQQFPRIQQISLLTDKLYCIPCCDSRFALDVLQASRCTAVGGATRAVERRRSSSIGAKDNPSSNRLLDFADQSEQFSDS